MPSRAVLVDRDNAFQLFRESYSGNASALENKELLRKLLLEAKALGEEVTPASSCCLCDSGMSDVINIICMQIDRTCSMSNRP